MTTPLETTNLQDFKLRIYWVVGLKSGRMVAEFNDCRWLPRIDETLVLPTEETGKYWHEFKVINVIYNFQQQTVQVWCNPTYVIPRNITSADFEKQAEFSFVAIEAAQKPEKIEELTQGRHQFAKKTEVNVDKELKRMKAEMASKELELLKSQITELEGRSPNL